MIKGGRNVSRYRNCISIYTVILEGYWEYVALCVKMKWLFLAFYVLLLAIILIAYKGVIWKLYSSKISSNHVSFICNLKAVL